MVSLQIPIVINIYIHILCSIHMGDGNLITDSIPSLLKRMIVRIFSLVVLPDHSFGTARLWTYTLYHIPNWTSGFSKMTSNPLVFLVHFETHLYCLAVMMILDPALTTNQHSWSEGPFLMVYVMEINCNWLNLSNFLAQKRFLEPSQNRYWIYIYIYICIFIEDKMVLIRNIFYSRVDLVWPLRPPFRKICLVFFPCVTCKRPQLMWWGLFEWDLASYKNKKSPTNR